MDLRIIETDTAAYKEMIALRYRVLLAPIGIPINYIDEEKEKEDFLIGYYDGNLLCGCCVLSPQNNSKIKLRQMAVNAPHQGKGIGKALVLLAEKFARSKGYIYMSLNARDSVIPFYLQCGYAIEGNGFTEVGVAHHTMVKPL